jgi:hypothetical protein
MGPALGADDEAVHGRTIGRKGVGQATGNLLISDFTLGNLVTALFEISYALFGRSARGGRTAVAGRGSQRRLWRSRSIVDPKTGIA